MIAKGVETAEQMRELQAIGCTMAQGFFLGEPAQAEQVPGVLGAGGAPAPTLSGSGSVAQPAGEPGVGGPLVG
jgi:predicted signal transduction protein with EAL and GGDEF domain